MSDMQASVPENPYLRTTDQAPRAVRVIAYLVWLAAATSAWGMILGLVLGRGFDLDLSFLLSGLTALGFLHARRGWRTFAVVILWISVTVALIVVVYFVYCLTSGSFRTTLKFFSIPVNDFWVFGSQSIAILKVAMICWFLATAGISLILLWILRRPAVRDWFNFLPFCRVNITPVTKHMLILVAILGIVPAGLAQLPYVLLPRPVNTAQYASSRSDNRGLCAAFGYRFNRLAYVVFVETPHGQSMSSPVQSWTSGSDLFGREPAVLEVPGGKKVTLPNATQLYEIVEGELRSSPERVSREQFEAFMDSNPEHFTINALLEFTRTHPVAPES